MNEYIFYTTEGFTQDPHGNEVENCQLMGVAWGNNRADALQRLLEENGWIKRHDYNPDKFVCRRLAACGDAGSLVSVNTLSKI